MVLSVRRLFGAILVVLSACTPRDAGEWTAAAMATGEDPGSGTSGPADTAVAPEAAEVVTAAVRTGELIQWVSTSGLVRARAAITKRADVSGPVVSVPAREGASVRAGEPLVHLEAEPFDLAVREAEARLAEAEQRLTDSYVPESLVTGQGPSAAQRQARLVRAGVLSARVGVERARRDRQRVTHRSPFAGTVDRVFVGAGEQVVAGQPIAQLVDAAHLLVEAQLLEHDLPQIRPGARVRVRSVAESAITRTGRVIAVLPSIDTLSHAGRVLVEMPRTGALRPGMSVAVELEGTRLARRLLVPTRAILERDGRALVFALRNGRAQWTYVVPGRSNGVDTELLPDSSTGALPLPVGVPVLIEGHQTLTHEAPVRVVGRLRRRSP